MSMITRHIPEPNSLTQIANYLKKCSSLKELECFYASMIKINVNKDCFLVNQFITACSSFHRADYAVLAFTQAKSPNVFVYNAMIKGFVHCSYPKQALQLYIEMISSQVSPSSYTFSSIVKACTQLSTSKFGETIHGHIWKFGFGFHLYIQTSLIDFYSILDKIVESRRVFDEMSERDVFAWTTMVYAYAQLGDVNCARKMFDEMPERNTAAWNTMIDGYARKGDVKSAELLFDEMPVRDIISWTTMINCYSHNKQYEKALAVFKEMTGQGISPDEVTMATVISACAHLGALDLGKEIHVYISQNGFNLDVYIGSALVDMYAKCGNLAESLVVFFKLREKNIFCWNSIIDGLAVHGHAQEAVAMFKKMEKEKINPNGVTFVSVLSACTHAGLVDEGRCIFHKMTREFSIFPEIEHYGCMVDLLCKAGLLKEALGLIENMRIEPNSVIWGALLGGCRLHKNMEIAGIAVEKLMILEPNSSGYYTLMVNMHAEANRWGEVATIRTAMKELGVEKRCPGSSWIEIEKTIHQFASSEKHHPASGVIYSLLDELDAQLKLAGHEFEFGFIS